MLGWDLEKSCWVKTFRMVIQTLIPTPHLTKPDLKFPWWNDNHSNKSVEMVQNRHRNIVHVNQSPMNYRDVTLSPSWPHVDMLTGPRNVDSVDTWQRNNAQCWGHCILAPGAGAVTDTPTDPDDASCDTRHSHSPLGHLWGSIFLTLDNG